MFLIDTSALTLDCILFSVFSPSIFLILYGFTNNFFNYDFLDTVFYGPALFYEDRFYIRT